MPVMAVVVPVMSITVMIVVAININDDAGPAITVARTLGSVETTSRDHQ